MNKWMFMSTVLVYADVSGRTTEAFRIARSDDVANRAYSSGIGWQELADEHLNAAPALVANGAHGVDALAGRVV